jgi:polyisoprenoid-binding protein YceI
MRALPLKNSGAWFAALALAAVAAAPASAKVYTAKRNESTLSYHMVHKLHEFTGVSRDFTCMVDLPADTSRARVYVKVPVVSFNSGNSSRDGNMLIYTEAAKYPNVEFVSDSVRSAGGTWNVHGKLTFHGVRRPVAFNVQPEIGGGKVRIRGDFKVLLSEFKVERPRLFLVPVDDTLSIAIDAVADGP